MNDAWVYLDVETRRYVYRASSLGSCTRSLVAARLGESASPLNANIRAAMDVSSGLEDELLLRAEGELGFPITNRQERVELRVPLDKDYPANNTPVAAPHVIVRGHIDGVADNCIIEAKCLSAANFEKYAQDGLEGLGSLGDKYAVQAAVYGHATARKVRLVVGKKWREEFHPDTGKWVLHDIIVGEPVDPESLISLDTIWEHIRRIEDYAKRDELPDCDGGCREGDPYSECHIFATPTVGDSDLEKLLRRDVELAEAIAALENERDELRKVVKESYALGKYTAGPYTLNLVKKNPSRFDSKAFRKRHPDLYEEYKVVGMPYVEMKVT